MNQVKEIMPGAILMVPDYNEPMPTDEENEQWYREFMREIGYEEGKTNGNNTTCNPAGVAGV